MIAQVRPATWFGILGPVEAVVEGVTVKVAAPRQRALLASLVLQANQLVTTDELTEHLWGEHPPANARASIQIHMTRLRKLLGHPTLDGRSQLIETRAHGYFLRLEPEQSDVFEFLEARAAASRARSDRELDAESKALSSALSVWRGEAFADVASESLHRDKVPYLLELKLEVIERRYEVELELGNHRRLISELRADVARHPLREGLWYFMMVALHRCGQQAEALEVYRTVSRILGQELGTAPSTALSALHRTILAAGSVEPQWTPAWTATCGLPADIPGFVGRVEVVTAITEQLTAASTSGIPVVSIDGPPGVGKTSLAVRTAHRLRKQFPDGQWYVRLSGSTRQGKQPGDVLAELLQATGVGRNLLPPDDDARAAMLRARMAGRRVLLVFDDVLSAEAVRSAIPGTAGSAVVVVGSSYLPDLVVHHSATPVHLGELSSAEARELLTVILGERRTLSESAAVGYLAEICAGLPLALRVAAAYLAGRPLLGIDDFVIQLRRGNPRSALLMGARDKSTLVTALDCVYLSLSKEAQRMLRLTGLLPGIDFTLGALGALTGANSPTVALDELMMSGLLRETTVGRFQANQLIQLYAAARVFGEEDRVERRFAIERLLEWYLYLGDTTIEQNNLAIAVSVAAPNGLHGLGRRIVMAIGPTLSPADAKRYHTSPRDGAEGTSDTTQIYTLNARALHLQRIGKTGDGTALLGEALDISRQRRDFRAEAFTLGNLTAAREHIGRLPESLGHATSAIALKRTIGSELDDPEDLYALAMILLYSGKADQAIAQLCRAVQISKLVGSTDAEVRAQCGLSVVYRGRRQGRRAVAHARKAEALASRAGDSGMMAMALNALGEALQVEAVLDGIPEQMPKAMEYHTRTLDISESIGDHLTSAHANIGLSAVFRHLGDHHRALEHAFLATELTGVNDFRLLHGKTLGVLAVANFTVRRFPISSDQIDEALEMHMSAGNSLEEECHRDWQRIIRQSETKARPKVLS
ncbi:BTAD domain-containing putative transcriptional regulator [Nocardia sp. NPDC060256]|uniref:AfsR/SARP family transcriptional regulator n=1 Tax=unclassified Nocardia TaxID=2637762 RepID=UPI00364EA749